MTDGLYLGIAFGLGTFNAVQIAMLAAVGRTLDPPSAAWISSNGTSAGLAVVLSVGILLGNGSGLPSPFDSESAVILAAVLGALVLIATMRTLPPYFAFTGLFATAGLVGIAFLVPKMGIAPVFSAITLGTTTATLAVDHVGAFGAVRRAVSWKRVLGLSLVATGTMLVRTAG